MLVARMANIAEALVVDWVLWLVITVSVSVVSLAGYAVWHSRRG